jgi:7-cyano-7-deazaguanine synthase
MTRPPKAPYPPGPPKRSGNRSAVVLFSGGLDSTTALHWARRKFATVTTLVIAYGQTHVIEVTMAQRIARDAGVACDVWELPLNLLVGSALLDDGQGIPTSLATSRDDAGVPHTYVPFRNGVFLSLAAAYGESRGIYDIVTGFNRIDTPDYPDTTSAFAKRMQAAINTGTATAKTGYRFRIHVPLVELTKQQIIRLGISLGADYRYSVSCYRGTERPCGHCPSCDIREQAFGGLGMTDPLIARLDEEQMK